MVRAFEKKGDLSVAEHELTGASVERLRTIMGAAGDDPMYDCYPVRTVTQATQLERFLSVRLNLKAYDYFVECESV